MILTLKSRMMKYLFIFFTIYCGTLRAQIREYPVIKSNGGIFDVPDAVEKPDPTLDYKIVVELAGGSGRPGEINPGLINVARMINLHSIGGVPTEKISVIVAVHNEASYSVMNNESYREKYKNDNPNLELYKELAEAGVKFFICGQSLVARNIDRKKLSDDVGIATSMLTVLTTYQLRGYAWFKF